MSDEFVTVTTTDALPAGQGGTFHVGERLIAVFNHQGEYFAIDDLCPHMGASLGAGQLDENGCVMCPWHAWSFNVTDGRWMDNPRLKIDRFEVRVHGTEVQVRPVKIVEESSEDTSPGET